MFQHKARRIRTFVHGDDYVSSAMPEQLKWLQGELEKKYQIKTQWLGSGKQYQQEVKILNRIVGWDDGRGIVFEVDPRHAEIIIEQLKLKDAKAVSTPGTKEEGRTSSDCEDPLDEGQASQYRAIAARCKYIVPDRPDLAYTVKELARRMAKPTNGDWQRLKRLGRYLVGRPRMQQIYPWQSSQTVLKVYTDADWAGCRETRKSTTGGCAVLGTHTLKGWSKTQALIALSSGESELYAALKASAEALGMIALLQDLGYTVKGEVWGDASAALGIINRRGLGKTRHIDTGLLWIQQTAAEQRLKYLKVLGKDNPADLYTKFLDVATSDSHVKRLKYTYPSGRSSEAPQLHNVSQSMDEYQHGEQYETCEWVKMLLNRIGVARIPRRTRRDQGSINSLGERGSPDAGRKNKPQTERKYMQTDAGPYKFIEWEYEESPEECWITKHNGASWETPQDYNHSHCHEKVMRFDAHYESRELMHEDQNKNGIAKNRNAGGEIEMNDSGNEETIDNDTTGVQLYQGISVNNV